MGNFKTDMKAVIDRDPAASSKIMVMCTYGGYKAIRRHRRAHWLNKHGFKNLALFVAAKTRRKTGVDIHPAAVIGKGVFIDHGVGVVIGETSEIGNNCTIYQGVTLGGTGKDIGKRHPTIQCDVMISSGAKVLGPITIGHNSKIGAGSVVLKEVPPHSTVVGIPGRIVKLKNEKVVDNLDQMSVPDPIMQELKRLCLRLQRVEESVGINSDCPYSIVDKDVIEEVNFDQIMADIAKNNNEKQIL